MKKLKLIGWLMLIGALACNAGFEAKDRFGTNGIYECIPGQGFIAPIYTFNSLDSTTLIWRGTDGGGLSFIDIETGDLIRLYSGNPFLYECSCIDTLTGRQ